MPYALKRLKLYYTDGSSDKEYIISSEAVSGGYSVYIHHGRRGSATRRVDKAPPGSLARAEAEFARLVAEKGTKGGYTTSLSGIPHSGVNLSAAIETGAPPVAPGLATMGAKLLRAAPWMKNASNLTVEDLLALPGSGVQAIPAGTRLMTLQTPTQVIAINAKDEKAGAVSSDVEKELLSVFPGWVLDGCFAAGVFTICDGYQVTIQEAGSPALATSGYEQSTAFSHRLRRLDALARDSKNKCVNIKVEPTYFADEALEALSFLYQPGAEVLVRKAHLGYEVKVKKEDPTEAYVCRTPA